MHVHNTAKIDKDWFKDKIEVGWRCFKGYYFYDYLSCLSIILVSKSHSWPSPGSKWPYGLKMYYYHCIVKNLAKWESELRQWVCLAINNIVIVHIHYTYACQLDFFWEYNKTRFVTWFKRKLWKIMQIYNFPLICISLHYRLGRR